VASRRAAVAIFLGLLLGAGCGSATNEADDGGSTSVGEPACAPFEGGTQSRTGGQPTGTMLLTDVTAAAEKCADRIAFDFRPDRSETPGYRVEYRPAEDAQTEDGSGNHVDVEGSAFLVVRMEPAATADLSGEDVKMTYTGPRRFAATGAKHATEVVKIGDFEGVVTWTIGLDERRPFRLVTSGSPPRLVVEIG